jgi:lipopolysaccharide transport system ATP-binding protein
MYLRLAFSVAVHLESEVLIMDEVLAVGDVSFQQKCLDKMHEIRQQGRTILFVSHSMPAVTRLCSRALLLDQGMVLNDGPAHQVVNDYLGSSWKVTSEREWNDLLLAPGNEIVKLIKVRSCSPNGETAQSVSISKKIGIELTYQVLRPGVILVPRIDLLSEDGAHIFASHDVEAEWRRTPRTPGRYVSTLWIPDNFLTAGNVLASASLVSHLPSTVTHAHEPKAITFQVLETDNAESARGDYVGSIPGVVRPLLPWSTELVTEKSAEHLLCEVQ